MNKITNYNPSRFTQELLKIDLNIPRDGMPSLRDYQVKGKSDIYKCWQTMRSVMFQMPTGTGKTRLFTSMIRDIFDVGARNKTALKILILAHRDELIDQIDQSLSTFHLKHGIIKSGNNEDKTAAIQVASVQSLNRRLDWWENFPFNYIIIDEAHHTLAKTYRNICDIWKNANILGVTATPYRLNHEPFTDIYDDIITTDPVYKFIEDKYLSDYSYYSIKKLSKLQGDINNIDDFDINGDFSEQAMMKIMDRQVIYGDIIKNYKKHAQGKKGIVYTINVSHNNKVAKAFKDSGYKVATVDAKTPKDKRKAIVSDFRNGEISILCNVNIFSEGFDCPDVEFIMLARPTMSLSLYLQQVGRGLRYCGDGKVALFIDLVGSANKFGIPSAKRQWKRHFLGQQVNDEPINDVDDKTRNHLRDRDIISRDDNLELIYSSIKTPDGIDESSAIDSGNYASFSKNGLYGLTYNEQEILEPRWDSLSVINLGGKTIVVGSIGNSYSIIFYFRGLADVREEKLKYVNTKYVHVGCIYYKQKSGYANYLLYNRGNVWGSFKFWGKDELGDNLLITYSTITGEIFVNNKCVKQRMNFQVPNGWIQYVSNGVFICKYEIPDGKGSVHKYTIGRITPTGNYTELFDPNYSYIDVKDASKLYFCLFNSDGGKIIRKLQPFSF